jgi:hypothetical protein
VRVCGIGHVARTGKDTAAAALVDDGWTRLSFADPLRNIAKASNLRLGRLVDDVGWEGAKFHMETTAVLERMGSALRREFGPDCLVNAVFDQMEEGGSYVIPDLRYPGEISRIREAGGLVVRVDRPGIGPSRPSDRHLCGYESWDGVLVNDGTPGDLGEAVRGLVADRL